MEGETGRSVPKARSLAYLHAIEVGRVKGLGGERADSLEEKGIRSVTDLLLHVPRKYIDRSRRTALDEVEEGVEITVVGRVGRVSSRRTRPRRGGRGVVIVEATITGDTGALKAVWFNQGYMARRLQRGAEVALSGKAKRYRGRLQITSPAVDVLAAGGGNLAVGRVVPVHPAVGEATPAKLRLGIRNALERSRPIADPLPAGMRERLRLISRDRAIGDVHFPDAMSSVVPARRRLVFDEFFRLEVALAMTRQRRKQASVGIPHLVIEDGLVGRFVEGLPYRLTGAQERVIGEIGRDMAGHHPMHRLLQGEVGSGKTVVAVATVLIGVQGNHQAAVMAPTEVLAEQHYQGIARLLADSGMAARPGGAVSLFDVAEGGDGPGLRVGLLTGRRAETNFRPRAGTSRAELLDLIAAGEIDILIGTHALIQEGVRFRRLGVAVVDEQHRFGVHQRVMLKDKAEGVDPDLLIMTATPIPRTLAMTLYGDLEVSDIDEMPPGRTPVRTWTASMSGPGPGKVQAAVRREVGKGRQAFVVCPLVDDSERVAAASAVSEYERLGEVLPDLRLGLMHGRLPPAEKETVMDSFRGGGLDVLVSTTVIEVGIDVPNATVMVIRDADRFGLSQLHQLRGRVGRGSHPSQCILMADPTTRDGRERIRAMVDLSDGFRLAEEDLRIRGHGTVFGARQSGFSDLRIGNLLRDRDDLRKAREEAFSLVERDPRLERHPEIREEVRVLLGERVEWLFRS